jgi:high affinity Mn2+ porin
MSRSSRFLFTACVAALAATASAQSTPPAAEDDVPAAIHGQVTWIRQYKPAVGGPYAGGNAIVPQREWSYSFTTTADLGIRLWKGAQLHLNPEGAQGVPLSNLTGAAALSNGELQRGAATELRSYRARLFLQQRIDVGGASERIEEDFNELGGTAAQRRWTLTVGVFSILDLFDPNPYAKDPREQFTSWAFLTHGGWDYPADARGYTAGAVADYRGAGWGIRFGRAAQPRLSNGLQLDHDLRRQYADLVEADTDLPLVLPAGPMRARLLLFRNRVNGARFSDALAAAGGGVPDLDPVRRLQTKRGWGLTLEAPLGDDQGVFVRASNNGGQVENYAFTDIDRQVAAGGQFSGAPLGRPQDRWGVGYAVNGLSSSHRQYFAQGGTTVFLGEGSLNYGPERLVETYYRIVLPEFGPARARLQSAFSVGFQHLSNPGYNRDRGPVRTFTGRWHSEF